MSLTNQEFDRLMFKHIREGMTKDEAYKAVMALVKVLKENHKKAKEEKKKVSFKDKFQEMKHGTKKR